MNKKRLIARLIVSPLILGLLIFAYSVGCIKRFVQYIRYGGEWLTYEKDDIKRMDDIYKLLKEQLIHSKTAEQVKSEILKYDFNK
jgi:hypothetical protein